MMECNIVNRNNTVFTEYVIQITVSESSYVLFINHVK